MKYNETTTNSYGQGKGRKLKKRYKKGGSRRKSSIRSNQKFWNIPKDLKLHQSHANCFTCVLSVNPEFKLLCPNQNTDSSEFLLLVNYIFHIVSKAIENCSKETKDLDFLNDFLSLK